MDGVVVIGEGEKDEAPMLYNGEHVGSGDPPEVDVAVDPIDGTTLTSLGRPNALSVIAVAERGTMFDPGPCVYMEKIAVGPEAAGVIDIDAPPTANLNVSPRSKAPVSDLTVVIPTVRPVLIKEVRDRRGHPHPAADVTAPHDRLGAAGVDVTLRRGPGRPRA